ncbi:MAG: ABC transporter permease [Actinobacteria bacterium]|nr:ABC transporter permease [Actinomycetota bacterium]
MKDSRKFSLGIDRFAGVYLLGLFILVFGLWKPDEFLTTGTLHSVASAQAITGMLAIAVVIPLAAGAYDLSVGATINLSSILAIWLQSKHGASIPVGIAAAIGVALLIGLVNAFVVVRLKVNSFIATLGMGSIVAATQIIIVGSTQPISPFTPAWAEITTRTVFGFQMVVVYLLIIGLIAWWFLARTPAGRYLYATGSNPDAAKLSGVAVGRWTGISLVLSSGIAGVAGVFYGSLFGPSLTYGQSLLLPAFAAAFLGTTLVAGGRFNIWGTLLAIYALATGVKGLQLVTGAPWLAQMFNGVALITAVAFTIWRRGAAEKASQQEAEHQIVDPGGGNAGNGSRAPRDAPAVRTEVT